MTTDEDGIAVIRVGGLGNQIFQVCSAFIVSKYNNCPLYIMDIDENDNPHNRFNNDYKKNIFKYFNKENNHSLNNYRVIHREISNCFKKWNPLEIKKRSIINNYGQYYPNLEPFKKELCDLLLKGLHELRNQIKLKNNITEDSIFIHIRRGDYVQHSDRHYLQPITYYNKAYNYIKEIKSLGNVYILSDDINWVKEQSFFQNIPNRIFWENDDELNTIALMSLCTGGAICANSTFSWWGAFIGAYTLNNPVIVPERWISTGIVDLFPKEWIIF